MGKFAKAITLSCWLIAGSTSASHRDLDIECEGAFYPSCCTAISDSGGSSPITYVWSATKGWYEASITPFNWTIHHCNALEFGNFNLYNDVDSGILIGHGGGSCSTI